MPSNAIHDDGDDWHRLAPRYGHAHMFVPVQAPAVYSQAHMFVPVQAPAVYSQAHMFVPVQAPAVYSQAPAFAVPVHQPPPEQRMDDNL
jgi:hypothetical protein